MTLEKDLRCPNCGERALTADNICWHCVEPLPWYDEDAGEEIRVREGWGLQASPSSIIVYAVISIGVIAGLILVMASLANQPKVQISLGTRPADGWEMITSENRSLTTFLPQEWTVLDRSVAEHETGIDELLTNNSHFLIGVDPLGGAVEDTEVIFLATGTITSPGGIAPFMIVAESEKLNRLNYDEASIFLDEGNFALSELRYIDDFDKSHLKIVVEHDLEVVDEKIRCRQQFIHGVEVSTLMALCAPAQYYASQQTMFEEISNIFQRLS